ncbi:hypothetical protein [uncultured Spirosoma sp.]|uniref:hypothetical protein n=1 Tax=uncultured Spirosoma sp. TaxID=278208 RepID=UPI0025910077|nr:hypothetical protein [uncultured Spirosoma sp.]
MEKLTEGDFLVRQSDESLWQFLGYDKGDMASKAEKIPFMGKPKDNDDLDDKQYILVRQISLDNGDGEADKEWLGIDEFRKEEKH